MRNLHSTTGSRRPTARPRLEVLEDRLAPATLLGLTTTNTLLRFDSASASTVTTITTTGLNMGENLLGIDFRPATGQLFGVTSANRLVTLNISGTTATVGTAVNLTADPTDGTNPFTALSGTSFGVDFNPVPDRLRVVSDTNQNLRINPNNGLVITDADLNPGAPDVVAAAYTNNFAGTTTTMLFGLDDVADRLVLQNPPNDGTLTTIGTNLGAGINLTLNAGFDVLTTGGGLTARVNNAFAAADFAGVAELYTIDLTAGTATIVSIIGGGLMPVFGLAVVPAGTLNFSVDSFAANENGGTATITITRTGGSLGAVSVDFTTTNGSATAGSDYTTTMMTVMFADGETSKTVNVPILDDLVTEGNETVLLALSNATADSVIGARGNATLNIRDNDLPSTTLFAVDSNNRNLLEFDSASPGSIRRTLPLVGLNTGDIVQGIDIRPADGKLYALITNAGVGRLATINILTGVVGTVANLAADPTDASNPFTALTGDDFGFDFNPVPDRLRITTDAGQNLRINPNNGLVITDLDLNPGTPHIVGSAYTNSFAGTTTTTLYAIDSTLDQLFIQTPPNNGTLTTPLALGVNVIDNLGFEINAVNNQAFASLLIGGTTTAQLHSINLTTGTATNLGTIGSGLVINGLTSMTVNDLNLTATQKLVNRLFTELLARNADASGLQNFSAMLDSGTALTNIASMILNSLEYRTNNIQDLYQRLLKRAANTTELNGALALLAQDRSITDVAVVIVGSAEYFTLNGATNATFLTAAFRDLLGRAIDVGGQTTFTALLNAGVSREQVARLIAGSLEAQTRDVSRLYTFFLLRTADTGGLNSFVALTQTGASIESITRLIVGSVEYAARA